MQFFSRNKALIATSVVAMGVLAACGDDVTVPPAVNPPVVISITPQVRAMNINETVNFAVQITGGSETTPPTLANCTSDNSSVATASVQGSACRVTAVAAGNVNVTAAASTGQTAAAAITVNAAAAAISNLSVSPTSANLPVGQKISIVPSVDRAASTNTVSYSYASSSSAIATVNATSGEVTAVAPGVATITVTATGSGTGYSNVTLTQGVTVTVVAAPSAVNSVTVTPQSLALAVSQTGSITTNVSTAAGAPASTVTYTTTDAAVASVSSSGVVTAVGQGNATVNVRVQNDGSATLSAYDQTFAVSVSVSAPAALTIVSVLQGPVVSMDSSDFGVGVVTDIPNLQVNQPVDLAATRDQIQVRVSVQPNGQVVDSVVLYFAEEATPNAPKRAGVQSYAGSPSSPSEIDIFVNTAEFVVDWDAGVATTLWPNGRKIISAAIFAKNVDGVSTKQSTATNDLFRPNFHNIDGWTTNWTAHIPSRTSQGGVGSNNNLNWHGGPGAAGAGNYTIVPVVYTVGRSVRTASTNVAVLSTSGIGTTGTACGTFNYAAGAPLPWNYSYGYGVTGLTVNCSGYEHPQVVAGNVKTNAPQVTFAIDNANQGYQLVTQPRGWRRATEADRPVAVRLDYKAPSVSISMNPQITGAEQGWANGAFSFVSATSAGDAGVGLPGTGVGRTYSWTGCTTGNGGTNVGFDGLVKPAGTTGEIPECNNDPLGGIGGNGPYTVTATQTDVLENQGSTTSSRFGVDKTNPVIQLADAQTLGTSAGISRMDLAIRTNTDSIFDNATTTFTSLAAVPVTSANALFGVRYKDERAGFRSDNHGTRSITRWAPAASPVLANTSVSSQVIATGWTTLNFDGNLANQESVVDAGDPTYRRDSISIFGNAAGQTAASTGYYFYKITVVDKAGNSSSLNRTAAIDITSPQITGVTIPAVLQGGQQVTFAPTGVDDLEAIDGDLFINYPTMAVAGDNAADPNAVANQNGRIRFRRNHFTDWHAAFAGATRNIVNTVSDGLLSTPFGPAAALSSGGLTTPVPFYQRLEVVQAAAANEDQGPHGRPAIVRLPSQPDLALIADHAVLNTYNSFKPTQLGVYAFDIRATSSVNFPERGMSSMQVPATESAYLENLFAANITQPSTDVNYWGKRDVDAVTGGTQNLWSWYCFSFVGSTLECRAETGQNVVNTPFNRVDFYRWNATANAGLTVADAAATAGQWVYIGSVTTQWPVNPALQDQGVTRFWRYTFSFAGFGTTGNHVTNTEGALAGGDVIRAVGVDAQGNAISTLNFTL